MYKRVKLAAKAIKSRSVILRIFILTCTSLFFNEPLSAQHFVKINEINIEGNNRTKRYVITNEIDFIQGDSIPIDQLEGILEKSRKQILATGLFNEAKLLLVNWEEDSADLVIDVQENWYIYPAIIFELADRNFNVWWEEQNRSFDRINYGLKMSHYNFTGGKDPFKVKVQFGYTRKYELDYIFPYVNRAKTFGVGLNVFYSNNKEIGYITEANKTQFRKAEDERVLLKRFRAGTRFSFRPKFQERHGLRIEFHRNAVDPFVRDSLNVNYFLDNRTSIKFFFAEYDFQYDKRVYSIYPQDGYLLFGNIKKEGFGIFNEYNNLSVFAGAELYTGINNKFVLANRIKAKSNLIRDQVSYANNTGLGWRQQDVVSGFELYVMDGTDYLISKNSLRFKAIEKNIKTAQWLPEQFEYMSFQIYLRLNFDFAYVNEPTYKEGNSLNNRWFAGFGPAVDLILFNNFLFSFEYSFNDIGENGLFLKSSVAF